MSGYTIMYFPCTDAIVKLWSGVRFQYISTYLWGKVIMNIRAAVVAIVMAAGLLLATSGTLSAQGLPCVCPSIRIDVAKGVACPVTVCYRVSPMGYTTCVKIQPGGSLTIPCGDWQDACIQLCGGKCYPLFDPSADSRCTPTLQVGSVCCVLACRVQSPDERCPHIEITPVAFCLGVPCD